MFYVVPKDRSIIKCLSSFDTLAEEPPPEVPAKDGFALQPIWLKVRVPKDATPGEYRATLTITLDGARSFSVPVHLKVRDWTLPDPHD